MNYKFDGDKVFFTSDTHFYHANIINFCKRPFANVETMNEALIENWNAVVGVDDIVFHLGDFFVLVAQLNGLTYSIGSMERYI